MDFGVEVMPRIMIREASSTHLSTTALAAILTGVGVVILGLLIGLVILLVRAVRRHKRLLADMEERGVVMAQSQKDADRSVTKPRAVVRRNTILPFNASSGWGALPSTETINPPEPPSVPPHYAPAKPPGFVGKPKRLSWPFSARRASGKAIHMRKIRVPRLSTVIESPKPSPMVPVLSGSLGGELATPRKSQSRPSSDQSLLQHHPAFRNIQQEGKLHSEVFKPEPLPRSPAAMPIKKLEPRMRPSRSQSATEASVSIKPGVKSRLPRPDVHVRSASMCSLSSGTAPDSGLPPLPLEVARIKLNDRRRSQLSRSPSRLSISSFESAGSSILATHPSPVMRSPNARVQKVMKRDWRDSMLIGPRPIRDTLTLHGRNQRSQGSIKSSVARFSSVAPSIQSELHGQKMNSSLPISLSMQSIGKFRSAEPGPLSKVSSPACSPHPRNSTASKRKSGSHVTPSGSPGDRRKRTSILQNVSGNHGAPQRQLSQASTQASSTRSSYGNPFQWDPAPMSAGKPSALKGSPSARKGHKRQNYVRISLVPTMLGPPSRCPSPTIHDIQEEPRHSASGRKTNSRPNSPSKRSPTRPPSTSTFAPDLKFSPGPNRSSLARSSPASTIASYDHSPIGSPSRGRNAYILPEILGHSRNRMSTSSMLSIPSFPSPVRDVAPARDMSSPPPMFSLGRSSNGSRDYPSSSDAVLGASSPFDMLSDTLPSSERPFLADEYDPERPHLVFSTPTPSPTKQFPSPFSTILEESSAQSNRTVFCGQTDKDSPPCSPKTIPPLILPTQTDHSVFNVSIDDVTIGDEPMQTIDPAILHKEAFDSLNRPFDNKSGSIMKTLNSSVSSIPLPTTPGFASSMFEPLLEAAFPSSPPLIKESVGPPSINQAMLDTVAGLEPLALSIQSSPGSMYSSPSPSGPPSPSSPCSPRPQHAQLPTPSINFKDMPTLAPSGPRSSPARPIRSSIQQLRRMNSDAEKGGRGERRYLRLGREDSIAVPGEESWLEDLSTYEGDEDEAWDEAKGRRLVGSILNDWEEEASVPILQDLQSEDLDQKSTALEDTDKAEEKVEEPKGLLATSSPKPDGAGSVDRSSSIWEDGEKFWASTPPPHPPYSPNKPEQRYFPLSTSPPASPTSLVQLSRKRDFEIAQDGASAPQTYSSKDSRTTAGANRTRRRNALGVSTPNVRIEVQPPSSEVRSEGTPGGGLYDTDGFLR